MNFKILTTISIFTLLTGCSISAPTTNLKDGAQNITVTKEKPKDGYELVVPVTVVHGKGCRDFGYLGSKEEALKELKNKTLELQADYAQITKISEPHLDGGCYVNEYAITALVYRKANNTKVASVPTQTIAKTNSDEEPFTKKMRELKSLLDDGLLTKEEYNTQRKKLLKQGFNAK